MRYVLAALSLTVLGCGTPFAVDETYHADVSFTLEERREILANAGRLSARAGKEILIVFDGRFSADRTILRLPAYSGGRIHGNSFGEQQIWVGIADTEGTPESPGPVNVAFIAAHELGHGIGMDHVSSRGSLMSPSWSLGGFRWTPQDEEELDRARARRQ